MPSEVSTLGRGQSMEELRRELAEAREQLATTAGILAAISNSPTDAYRVFAEIAASAARLCDAYDATIYQVDGDFLHPIAHHGPIPQSGTLPLTRGYITGRAALDRRPIHVADMQAETYEFPESSDFARRLGHRTILAVPLNRAGAAIGVINIRRTEVRPFTDRQIELLKAFADQAVIAIENARLFEAEQASKRERQESLEYQTAISEVLGVISRSPTDVQPVFDTIARSALHLCAGTFTCVFRFDGRLIHFVAAHGTTPEGFEALRNTYPLPPGRASATTRAIETGAVAEIPDVDADPDYEHRYIAGVQNYKSLASVPMLKDGRPIGTITVGQAKTGRFPPRQIALLRTFADQAAIAIENTRLFEAEQARTREVEVKSTELAQSLEYQTAISAVLGVISRSPNELQPVFNTIVTSSKRLLRARGALVTRVVGQELRLAAFNAISPEADQVLQNMYPIKLDDGTNPAVAAVRERTPFVVQDSATELARRRGFRSLLIVPMLSKGEAIGSIHVSRPEPGPFSDEEIGLLKTFADQAVIAIDNTRLFEAVQARTRELAKTVEDLEIASQHKNQFVANMSHELRTPLAAILGYAELIQEGFYEPQGPKSLDALTRIRSNGKHLLGLINTVLDIAKIESGQFTLNMTEYAIESVVETVRAATESLAQNKKLTLTTSVDKSLPVGL